jgi:deoxyribonuclease-4
MPLGAHLPTSKGYVAALAHARSADCDCLQIFSKSPRQWEAPPLDAAKADAFRHAWGESSCCPLVVHDSYLINLAAPDDTIREKSIRAMIDEVERADLLGADYLVTHCGAHLCRQEVKKGKGDGVKKSSDEQTNLFETQDTFSPPHIFTSAEAVGLKRLSESLKRVLDATPGARVKIALENTAAQGTCLGGPFEHIAEVLQQVGSERLAMCFDTCHAFAAGHDLTNDLEGVLKNLDETIGLNRLGVIHLNDSKGALGKHLDRHAHIGEGLIGREALQRLVTHPRLQHLPLILETPETETMLETNLNTVRALRGDTNER